MISVGRVFSTGMFRLGNQLVLWPWESHRTSLCLMISLRYYWTTTSWNLLQGTMRTTTTILKAGVHYQSTDNPDHVLSEGQGQNHTRWPVIQLKHTQSLSKCLTLKGFRDTKSLWLLLCLLAEVSLILSLLKAECTDNESQRLFLNLELSSWPLAVYLDTYGWKPM